MALISIKYTHVCMVFLSHIGGYVDFSCTMFTLVGMRRLPKIPRLKLRAGTVLSSTHGGLLDRVETIDVGSVALASDSASAERRARV
jgi:hypothetical protein